MPKNKALRVEIIQLYYDVLVAEYERSGDMELLVARSDERC